MQPHELSSPGYTAWAVLDPVGARIVYTVHPSHQTPRVTPRSLWFRLPVNVDASKISEWFGTNDEVAWLILRIYEGFSVDSYEYSSDACDAIKSLDLLLEEAPTVS